jgi:hypothetical protein
MNRYGQVSVAKGAIEYLPGEVDAAEPRGPWSIPAGEVTRIVEKTFPVGPVFDYFVVFRSKRGDFAVPLEAFEELGLPQTLEAIGREVGANLVLGLANRTDVAERLIFERA